MTNLSASIEIPKWDAVILICKDCRKRKNGPQHLKAKALVKIARRDLHEARPRPRVASVSCLGVCPKHAIAVACLGDGLPPRVMRIETRGAFADALPLLTHRDPAVPEAR
jgi:predicted metal-binding protein